jgi:predicted DNA-binding antitoxin AbrB/MazE fold protein
MVRTVQAVYENGVLRPLEPLPLEERERVTVTVSDALGMTERSRLDIGYIESARKEVAAMERMPALEEVQRLLSIIPGSVAADIIAEREDGCRNVSSAEDLRRARKKNPHLTPDSGGDPVGSRRQGAHRRDRKRDR